MLIAKIFLSFQLNTYTQISLSASEIKQYNLIRKKKPTRILLQETFPDHAIKIPLITFTWKLYITKINFTSQQLIYINYAYYMHKFLFHFSFLNTLFTLSLLNATKATSWISQLKFHPKVLTDKIFLSFQLNIYTRFSLSASKIKHYTLVRK